MKLNLTCDKGNYRIDFTLDGKRKRFYPGTRDEVTAKQIYRQMSYEWELGQFDLSLDRYRLKNRKQTSPEKNPQIFEKKNLKLLKLWDRWVESLRLPEKTKNGHYHYIRQARDIVKSGVRQKIKRRPATGLSCGFPPRLVVHL